VAPSKIRVRVKSIFVSNCGWVVFRGGNGGGAGFKFHNFIARAISDECAPPGCSDTVNHPSSQKESVLVYSPRRA